MIKLAVASYDSAAPVTPMAAVFGGQRRTVGRSDDNFLILPDPSHEVSRLQAAVWSEGARHTLVSLSDATPVLLNGVELAPGADTAIKPGDMLQIGLYQLRVEEAPAASAEAADLAALKSAFLRGAGIAPDAISAEWTPELMELLGKLMASSLQGMIDLLALRSLVKQEVKADVTMVVVRNNNPLKFFPDSQTVLIQMLRKKMPGFMEPLESLDDACHDLRGHQMGVVAGTRASMDSILGRLKPGQFEAELPPPTMIDALAPSRRKAALWELYAQQYQALAGESKDQFKTLFGAAFLAAYELEVDRFNGSRGRG
ncbi:MAG TPA: type VI secretion system-associated FHA domain protein TagH [Telluria sp.]|nr:type VI secretion system-associated FHA domain protein TagH [Telluria sp.]